MKGHWLKLSIKIFYGSVQCSEFGLEKIFTNDQSSYAISPDPNSK